MSALKRKHPGLGLERRVRVRHEEEPESEVEVSDEKSDDDSSDEDEDDANNSGSEASSEEEDEEENEEEDEGGAKGIDTSKVSFGALARAQASLAPSEARRRRKEAPDASSAAGAAENQSRSSSATMAPRESKSKERPPKRSSKNAPEEVTSKVRVSRRRDFVHVPKAPQPRDPRFDPAVMRKSSSGNAKLDEIVARRRYAFLDGYRDDEIRQLKAAVKKARAPEDKDQLLRALASREGEKKTQERRDRERGVLEEHRRKEKELVKQGKKPFYLKKSDQKKEFLKAKFEGMSDKKLDRAMARRQKKLAGKEKKRMPLQRRRTAEDA